MNNVIKASLWYIISNVLLRGISFLTTPIFSRILSVEEYGMYGLFTSWESILTVILTLSMSSSIIRARFDFQHELNRFISSILAFNIFIPVICIILNIFIGNKIANLLNLEPWMLTCMLVMLCTSHAINTYKIFERFTGGYKKQVIISIIVALLSTIVSLLFVIIFENKLFGRIFGSVLVYFIVGLILCFIFLKRGKPRLLHIKYALPICIPYIPHVLASSILVSFDRVIIAKYCGSSDTALYSLAYTCSLAITVINSSLNEAIAPWLGDCLHKKEYNTIKSKINIYVVILFITYILFVILSPELLLVMGGEKYLEAMWVIPWVICGVFLQTITSLYVNIEQFEGKTMGIAIGTFIASLVNIVLNCIFVPRFGYISAAIITLFSYIILFFIHYFLVKKINFGNVYNNRFIIFILGLSILILLPILCLYKHMILRYITIILLIVVCIFMIYKHKEMIFEFIRVRRIRK